ncbi:mitochondrial carrier [Multifurca ochricompacta]|uniref:Mitochondrial carrier n=1 Tax=Multifurca ochricompacta TaxID=376703 RepID=A0AAD4QQE4_9AGAM|nr:mitochondrial carrier [Multifurca ochricompacta]
MEASPDALNPCIHDSSRRGSPAVRAAKDIAFGSAAGIVSKVFEHPFDLTKVRLQAQVLDTTARFHGPLDCLVQTFKSEGVRGLYRGLPAPIVGAMAENASLFLAYGELQNLIRHEWDIPLTQALPLPQLALAAAGAGTITSFVLTPIELVKCKMQVQMLVTTPSLSTITSSTRDLPGPFAILRDVLRMGGVRGLWLGQTGTLIRETGGSAAWFGTKELVCNLLRKDAPERQLKPWESALSGACAGGAYNLAFFPADTVKSTMQTEAELRPGTTVQRSFLTVARELYRAQGVRGLYAGCGITVARSVPSSALIFWIYDGLRARFG